MEIMDGIYGLADQGGGSHFQKGGPQDVLQLLEYHTALHPFGVAALTCTAGEIKQ